MPREIPTGIYFLIFVGLLSANVFVYHDIYRPAVLSISVFNSPKGTPLLLESPSGKTVLIDTGADASILRSLGESLPMWERNLDAVFLTSASKNASGALPDVQSRYKISSLIRSAHRGDRYALLDGTYLDVLWPPKTVEPLNASNGALVLRISYGNTSFLIKDNLPPRISVYLSTLDANIPAPNLVISSSTPKGVYISNGDAVYKK
jgi:beta-lactamase superfamily II metal-dependent hydrolase